MFINNFKRILKKESQVGKTGKAPVRQCDDTETTEKQLFCLFDPCIANMPILVGL